MILEAAPLAARLVALAESLRTKGLSERDADQRRYILSSAQLIERERIKLQSAITAQDDSHVMWALRSIADMMKGLMDIGSRIPQSEPALWTEASRIAQDAHTIESNKRQR